MTMKLVKTDPKKLAAQMTHQQLQNNELRDSLSEYYEFSDAIRSAYQPDRDTDLALAKVSVFRTLTQKQTIESMYENRLPKCFVEVQHSEMYDVDSNDLQKNLLRTIKTKQKMHYSGSRRQHQKRLDVTYFNSSFFYNEHSLKRLYERSALRALTASDFFFFKPEYIEEIAKQISFLELNEETQTIDCRKDILLPFKNVGAFMCSMIMTPSESVEKYSFVPQTFETTRAPDSELTMPALKAHTFFSYEMLNKEQHEVCELFYIEEYKRAAHAMSRIDAIESRVHKHAFVRCAKTNQPISSIDIIQKRHKQHLSDSD
jgi:hypothetical protein